MANLAQAFGKAAQTFANVYVSERARQDEMNEERRWKEFYGKLAEGQFNLQKEQADREQERFTYQMERDRKQDEQELAKLEAYDQTARANGYRDWNTFQALSDVEKQQVFMNQSRLEEQLINLRMTEIKHGMAMQSQAAGRAAADRKSKDFEAVRELTDKIGDPTLAQELFTLSKKFDAGVATDEDKKNYADMTKRAQELAVKRKAELEKLADAGKPNDMSDSAYLNLMQMGAKAGKPENAVEFIDLWSKGRQNWTPEDKSRAGQLMQSLSPADSLDMSEVANQINALTVAEEDVIERFGMEVLGADGKPYKERPTDGPGKELLDKIGMSKNALLAQTFGDNTSTPGMPSAPVDPTGAYRTQTMADVAKSAGTEDVTSMTFYPKDNPAAATTVPKTSPNLAALMEGVQKGILEVAKGDQHSAAASEMSMTERATGNDSGAVVAQILGGFVGQGFDNQLGTPDVSVFSELGDAMKAASKRKYPSATRYSGQSGAGLTDFMKWLKQE